MTMISHKHKFIFIKTRKTAGTSLEIFLSKFCGDLDVLTLLSEDKEKQRYEISGRYAQNYTKSLSEFTLRDVYLLARTKKPPRRFLEHLQAKNIKDIVSDEVWNSYFKFCFERNPWSKTGSNYFWKNSKSHNQFTSFRDYLLRGKHTHVNWEYYTINDKICVDFIGRFENLADDLGIVLDKLGISFDGDLPTAKHLGDRKASYRSYYDDFSREYVEELFKKEIRAFEFRFEDLTSNLPCKRRS